MKKKYEKTQYALAGLGRAALAVAVAIPRYGSPNFPKGIIKCKVCVCVTVSACACVCVCLCLRVFYYLIILLIIMFATDFYDGVSVLYCFLLSDFHVS